MPFTGSRLFRGRFPFVLLIWMAFFFAPFFLSTLEGIHLPFVSYESCVQNQETPREDFGWEILRYDTHTRIDTNGLLHVTENIEVMFDTYKHGIYRYIPLAYEPKGAGFNTHFSKLDIDNIQVLFDGVPARYTTEKRFSSQCLHGLLAHEFNQEIFLKIGDPKVSLTGAHTYQISYTVADALRTDRGKTELYWNAIGPNWGVPIRSASVRLTYPRNTSTSHATPFCYVGSVGSDDTRRCTISQQHTTTFMNSENLAPFEGVTFLTHVEDMQNPTWEKNIGGTQRARNEYLASRWFVFLACVPLLYFLFLWYREGKGPISRGIIAPRYTAPDDISPARSGLILDQRVDSIDIASVVISIAQKGHMKIIQEPGLFGLGKSYTFEKLSTPRVHPLSPEETIIYEGIFSRGNTVKLSSLKEKFATTIDRMKDTLFEWAKTSGYLRDQPSVFHGQFLLGYVGLGIAFVMGYLALSPLMMIFSVIATVCSCTIVLMFQYYTPKGKAMQEEVRGLKLYMSTAEKDRIEFHNAPEKTPELFQRLLPYAMALGVVAIWADKFKDLEMKPPEWFVGGYHLFNPTVFAQDLTSAGAHFNSTMTSVKSSSGSSGFGGGGGGFSGGGGGGGGGGSW